MWRNLNEFSHRSIRDMLFLAFCSGLVVGWLLL